MHQQRVRQRGFDYEREHQRLDFAEISNAMVRLYKELFGRGPTKARSNLAGPDILVCTLENSFTPAEQSMARAGDHQRLRELRQYFQHSSEEDFVEAVEQITGRRVRAFVSGVDTANDVATEVFYFESLPDASGNSDGYGGEPPR